MKKNRMIILIIAAVVIAGIGFGAGMMVKSSTAGGAQLTADEAKQIALSSVGVSAEKATFTKAVFDEGVYEIDFYTASNEYDFEVSADSGAIIEREVSARDLALGVNDSQSAAEPSVNNAAETQPSSEVPVQNNTDDDVIGVDAAKQIALDNAGVSSASFTKAYLDYDDGIRVYDIEFNTDNKEYDYEIDAHTGKILDRDVKRFDYDD